MTPRKSQPHKLIRTAMKASRLLDFSSEKELVAQVGHGKDDWPLVVLKEPMDNSLDACEEAGIAPEITVVVDGHGITISDNGPGISPETVTGMLDFSARVSSREAYVSPTRGAQGNALKTILTMPFVLDGKQGRIDIAARGVRHAICVALDKIRQAPIIGHEPKIDPNVKSGTCVRIWWPECACPLLHDAKARFLQIAEDYTFLNPHLTLRVCWWDEEFLFEATDRSWLKWQPNRPTSIHWYDLERFGHLIAGYIAHDRDQRTDRLVRNFIAEFDGLSSSGKQKAVLAATGLVRTNLSQLANKDGLDEGRVEQLLKAMKAETRPLKPKALGWIGEHHLKRRFSAIGCEPETFRYRRQFGETAGIPWVQEVAFGYCPTATQRRFISGVNWSPGIINPFRELGRRGESLDSLLERLRTGQDEPIILMLHIACARVEYTDRGKSAVVIRGPAEDEVEEDSEVEEDDEDEDVEDDEDLEEDEDV